MFCSNPESINILLVCLEIAENLKHVFAFPVKIQLFTCMLIDDFFLFLHVKVRRKKILFSGAKFWLRIKLFKK